MYTVHSLIKGYSITDSFLIYQRSDLLIIRTSMLFSKQKMLMDQRPKKLSLENYSYTASLQIVNVPFFIYKIGNKTQTHE